VALACRQSGQGIDAVHPGAGNGETPVGSGALKGHVPLDEVIERFGG